MAESNFSWFKIASFIGAGLLLIVAIVAIASGITLITESDTTRGVITIVSGLVCGVNAYAVYKHYQNETEK